MELNKVDDQIKKLQEKRKALLKKEEDKAVKELLSKTFGKNWFNVYEKLKNDSNSTISVTINGRSLDDYLS